MVDDGRIVEEGTHGDLLDREGLYSDLYRTQLDRDAEKAAPTDALETA